VEFFSWIFFGPAQLIASWSYAGVAIAGGLFALQAWRTHRAAEKLDIGFFRRTPVFAGLLWLIFNAYELQMRAIEAKAGGGFLRLDLVVLVPILYVLTAAAVMSLLRPATKTPVKPDRTDSNA
jgi:hypothetical protein